MGRPQTNVFIVFSEIKDLSGQGMRKKELKYIKIGFLKVHIQSLKYYHEIMIKANSSFKMPITFKLHLKM